MDFDIARREDNVYSLAFVNLDVGFKAKYVVDAGISSKGVHSSGVTARNDP